MATPDTSKSKEYTTVSEIAGPLMVVEKVSGVAFGEVVRIRASDGSERLGQVLEARTNETIAEMAVLCQ